jgi:hypothetical protein
MGKQSFDGQIYEGSGDDLAGNIDHGSRIILLPDAPLSQREPLGTEHIRILWGQRLIDDLLAGRYRALVCAVNSRDNSRGIISMLAQTLPTSQWNERLITEYAKQFVQSENVTILKYDMDRVMVLALLRPANSNSLTVEHLAAGFRTVSRMLQGRPDRLPCASVCFLGARANKLVDANGREPSFESVLHAMYEGGYRGDVYPSPWMWESAPAGVFPRYPFPDSFKQMVAGGF